ncbi:MAG: GIY-YIG nuclease family protein [Clostridiales bacterium]|nr:GIY-YIG nuclease family protein [Clostridiales bacterium]
MEKGNFVYILRCGDGSLYTGWTTDLDRRVRMHNAGKGGKYTRSHRPVELVYYESFPDANTARKREYAIKQMTRPEKRSLVERARQKPEDLE